MTRYRITANRIGRPPSSHSSLALVLDYLEALTRASLHLVPFGAQWIVCCDGGEIARVAAVSV